MATATTQEEKIPTEVTALFSNHLEALVIYVDPVESHDEHAVAVFIKMLDKNKGGRLASLLRGILDRLEAMYGEKRSGMSRQTSADT